MGKLVSGFLVLTLALGLAACGDDDDDDAADAEDTGGDTIEVTIAGTAFDPTEIEAAAGDATFAVSNEDGFAHTFTVDDLEVDLHLDGGASDTATVRLESGETYDFRCTIHSSMQGTITVS